MTVISQADIINSALALIGHGEITDFSTEVGAPAQLLYYKTVKSKLSSYWWRFSIRAETLTQLSNKGTGYAPDDYYDYAYNIPTSLLRAVGLSSYAEYEIYGDELYTNESTDVELIYIKEVVAPEFAPYFTDALVYDLAAQYALAVADRASAANVLFAKAKDEWTIAKYLDSQSSYPVARLNVQISRLLNTMPVQRP